MYRAMAALQSHQPMRRVIGCQDLRQDLCQASSSDGSHHIKRGGPALSAVSAAAPTLGAGDFIAAADQTCSAAHSRLVDHRIDDFVISCLHAAHNGA